MIRAALTVVALLLPVAALARPERVTEYRMDMRPQPRGEVLLRSIMIAAHNQARSQYGVGPLVWDEGLARDAAAYAQVMAETGKFEHDPQRGRIPQQGENLFVGTSTAYSYDSMISYLIDERRYYRPGRFPEVSRTGDWEDVGHYTQIIWPTTRRVGCAMASNQADDYLVCRYLPAGNVYGTVLR